MKKLIKLKLKPEKMLSHDELISYRGGSCIAFCNTCSTYECSICMGECYGNCAVNYENDPSGELECQSWCSQYCTAGA